MSESIVAHPIGGRFRGFLPVVVDVETGGFNAATDALLEIAAVFVLMDDKGFFRRGETVSTHVQPFREANIEQASLDVNGIDPWHPLRIALPERDALGFVFGKIRKAVKANHCNRAILVGHNASFDLGFVNAAVARTEIKRNPFHPFSSLDTVTLGAMAHGQTVLSRILDAANIPFDDNEAHSAIYDAEKTADLFCSIINRWQRMESTSSWDQVGSDSELRNDAEA
ncbi:MAG: ribonuclease T [Pseudomonadota bacterium]|nr:ribonuclease T [Pseudomonadota bacterium]